MRIGFNSVEEVQLLLDVVGSYRTHVHNRFHRLLFEIAPHYTPAPLKAYLDRLELIGKRLAELCQQGDNGWLEIDGKVFAPYLRHAVIDARLSRARSVEARRARTTHPELQAKLDAELKPFAQFLNAPWFRQAESIPVPQLADFFPIELVESELAEQKSRPREFDEKFHILQAPDLFLHDLDRARAVSSIRGLRVAVAYLDIDHFKSFNSETTETFVDRNVLPKFMRHIEAHVYMRGHAYRFGGDEYGIILHNVIEEEALASMERLRVGLAALCYEGTKKTTTVSIGVVIVQSDSHLTGHEIQQAANSAKNVAKAQGRNRTATYDSPLLQAGDVRIVADPGTATD